MTILCRLPSDGRELMNAIKSDFMPGVRGLYAPALRVPGTYKGGPAGRHVVWRSGRAF